MMSYLVASNHAANIVSIFHPLSCKICLDFYSYFRLFWETCRHNTTQRWNNNADSIECRHCQAKTKSGKWAPDSINNYHSWDMLHIQRKGSLCSAFLTGARGNRTIFHQARSKTDFIAVSWGYTNIDLNKPELLNSEWVLWIISSTFCLWDGPSNFSGPMNTDTKNCLWKVTFLMTLNAQHGDSIQSV